MFSLEHAQFVIAPARLISSFFAIVPLKYYYKEKMKLWITKL